MSRPAAKRDGKATKPPAEQEKLSRRQWYGVLLLCLAAVCSLCLMDYVSGVFSSTPRAPLLRDDPVFESKNEGMRFVAPEGWSMRARAELPPGTTAQERLLVEYKRLTSDKPASLEVSRIDLPESKSLNEAMKTRQPSDGELVRKSPPEELTLDQVPALRVTFTERVDKQQMISEVVAVRRGERVYFFSGFFPAEDARAREQVRGMIGSIVWLDR